jgi:hypothetical protein
MPYELHENSVACTQRNSSLQKLGLKKKHYGGVTEEVLTNIIQRNEGDEL